MSREITIITPENATITYELAGLGSRAIAFLLDALIQAGLLLAVFIVAMCVTGGAVALMGSNGGSVADVWMAVTGLVIFLITFGYYMIYEGRCNGQTVGKRAMGLRVIREEGTPIDYASSAIRNLVRIIEVLPFPVVCGITIFASPRYKRLGDYAAGTLVVKERAPSTAVPQISQVRIKPTIIPTVESEHAQDADLLTKDEFAAVRTFVERRAELDRQVQEVVGKQIAVPIMTRLEIRDPGGSFSYANFLDEMYIRYVDERGAL